MPINLISSLQRRGYPVEIYGSGNTENLLHWGEAYYSIDLNHPIPEDLPDHFTVHFPATPVFVEGISIKTGTDVFPTKWSISFSSDNTTFLEVMNNSTALCKPENQIVGHVRSKLCNISQLNQISIPETKR